MHYWEAVYAFLVAMGIAALLTPLAGRLALKIGAISYPSDRGMAEKPMPALGGLAILIGVLVAGVIWLPATIHLRPVPHAAPGSGGVVHTWALLAGAGIIALVGGIDDIVDLHPLLKLIGQIGAALVAVLGGAVVQSLTLPFIGSLQFLSHTGGVLTVIWLVALMNVVNLSDGVDGLAAGVCTIDGIAFTIIAFDLQGGLSYAALLAAITAGGSLGFLFHNFPPARIFMGDIGSNLLGYLLALAAIIGSLKTGAVVALLVPLLILAVPLLDTTFVVLKRLKYGHAPWHADQEHFHHRLNRLDFSARRSIAYLYAWSALMAGIAVALRFVPYSDHNGHFHLGWSLVMLGIILIGLSASVYLVWVLEILKFKGLRSRQLRAADPDTTEFEITVTVQRDIETGEFERVK